jgi:hypothetical protein
MKSNLVSIAELDRGGRWRVETFLSDERDFLESKWPMVKIGSICREESDAVAPPQKGEGSFIYIGLENIESITGDLVGEIGKPYGAVKSRSKVFKRGDVLYGRLRPGLRKVFSAYKIESGLCSTEFIVLKPNEKVSDQVLRAILASEWVSSQLEKLQIGAALPRVSSKDLLAMKVPLPDRQTQTHLETELAKLSQERVAAKRIISSGPAAFEEAVTKAIT